MMAAALVVGLVVFVVPISLLLLAFIADLVVVAWVVGDIIHKEWWPRMLHPLTYAATIRAHHFHHARPR